jgi:hypothetical protein
MSDESRGVPEDELTHALVLDLLALLCMHGIPACRLIHELYKAVGILDRDLSEPPVPVEDVEDIAFSHQLAWKVP